MGMGPWEKSPEGASPLKEEGIIMGPSKKPVLSAVEGSKWVIPSGILLLMAEVEVGENEAMPASEKPEEA